MKLTELIAPLEEPITIADLKNALKLENDDDISHLQNCLISARDALEKLYELSFVTRTYRYTIDIYPEKLRLPMPPAASLLEVRVKDSEDTYRILNINKIMLSNDKVLFYEFPPEPFTLHNGIEIDYTAGFGDAAKVPASIKHALRLLACHYYQYRSAMGGAPATHKLPQDVRDLMTSYRKYRI